MRGGRHIWEKEGAEKIGQKFVLNGRSYLTQGKTSLGRAGKRKKVIGCISVHVVGNDGGDMGNMRLYVPPSSFALRLSSFLFLSLSDTSFTFQGGLYIGHATGRVKIRQNQAR